MKYFLIALLYIALSIGLLLWGSSYYINSSQNNFALLLISIMPYLIFALISIGMSFVLNKNGAKRLRFHKSLRNLQLILSSCYLVLFICAFDLVRSNRGVDLQEKNCELANQNSLTDRFFNSDTSPSSA